MAASSGDQLALFNQYDSEYCSKATEVARKIQAVASLSGDQRRVKARELEADLKEADQIVRPAHGCCLLVNSRPRSLVQSDCARHLLRGALLVTVVY